MLKPTLQALLLADHVYQDKASGKKIIAGTFNVLNVRKPKPAADDTTSGAQEPAKPGEGLRQLSAAEVMRAGSPFAFISLTEIRGPTSLELRYVDLSNNAVLVNACFSVTQEDPLETVEAIVPMPQLPAPHTGVYALELIWNDELMGCLRIKVVDASDS